MEIKLEKELNIEELESLAAVGGNDAGVVPESRISALLCISAISVLTCSMVSVSVSVLAGCTK
ncbi:hypothetical protein G8B50_00300 [Enterococcus durans]|uniref:hypothetical protein n=1 Tax=Enterococcus durans TaxID=53345 RepID=UPI001883588C|nr:hypothetical protein [Enterococcus durans]MBE9886151.1 hypothetical protein [Enterococcus durans]